MKLAICIPSMSQVHADFLTSFNNMIAYIMSNPPVMPFELDIVNYQSSLVHLNREILARRAVAENSDVQLWLDSDMTFPKDVFHRLYAHDLDFVACNYVQRAIPSKPNAVTLDMKACYTRPESTGLEEIRSVGLGVALIKTSVFNDMPPPWFDTYWYQKEGQEEHAMIGEDVFFCSKVQHSGKKVFVDHDLSREIGHLGTIEFTHDMVEIPNES